ncbi:Glycosyl transferase family 8 [Acetobacter malorum]|uniref:Glycosyl transferase family 8 n=1 Tax=Acetobacter malorum TaxID=178901 RepID=A0A177G486_9PROT|nr:glycosyltransferase [Acetobacter malorum]OAG75160.1 Glycosyl transferase family 8 [Acetobacter malorum]
MYIVTNHTFKILGFTGELERKKEVKFFSIDDCFEPVLTDGKNFFANKEMFFFSISKDKIFISKENNNFPVEVNFYGDFEFTLSINGAFISYNGQSFFMQYFKGEWEVFYLIKDRSFKILKSAFKNGFYLKGEKSYIESKEINYIDGKISYANYLIGVDNIKESKELNGNSLIIPTNKLPLLFIEKFNPLVFYACFGSGQIIDCLEESIYSLFVFGEFSGDVMIITDQEEVVFSKKMEPFLHRIKFKITNAFDFFDFTISRYKIYDIKEMQEYSPIMYLDCDIIVNKNINEIFHKAMQTEKLLVSEEFKLNEASVWFGGTHWHEAANRFEILDCGINSGIFIFKNIESIKPILFTVVESMIHAQKIKISREKAVLETLDQPNLNYALMAHFPDNFDTEILTQYVLHGARENFSDISMLGFAHFNGGIGNFESRYALIRGYVEYLSSKYLLIENP